MKMSQYEMNLHDMSQVMQFWMMQLMLDCNLRKLRHERNAVIILYTSTTERFSGNCLRYKMFLNFDR